MSDGLEPLAFAAGEDDAYYSPRSDSTLSSFTERGSPNLDALSTSHPRLENLESSKNMGSSKQVHPFPPPSL